MRIQMGMQILVYKVNFGFTFKFNFWLVQFGTSWIVYFIFKFVIKSK